MGTRQAKAEERKHDVELKGGAGAEQGRHR